MTEKLSVLWIRSPPGYIVIGKRNIFMRDCIQSIEPLDSSATPSFRTKRVLRPAGERRQKRAKVESNSTHVESAR
jgi:hypothetical protein